MTENNKTLIAKKYIIQNELTGKVIYEDTDYNTVFKKMVSGFPNDKNKKLIYGTKTLMSSCSIF